MKRTYPYKIVLLYYSGKRETHYIKAENHMDAFSKAHRFCNPFDPHDGVQFITDTKLTKQYCIDNNITFEEV